MRPLRLLLLLSFTPKNARPEGKLCTLEFGRRQCFSRDLPFASTSPSQPCCARVRGEKILRQHNLPQDSRHPAVQNGGTFSFHRRPFRSSCRLSRAQLQLVSPLSAMVGLSFRSSLPHPVLWPYFGLLICKWLQSGCSSRAYSTRAARITSGRHSKLQGM